MWAFSAKVENVSHMYADLWSRQVIFLNSILFPILILKKQTWQMLVTKVAIPETNALRTSHRIRNPTQKALCVFDFERPKDM